MAGGHHGPGVRGRGHSHAPPPALQTGQRGPLLLGRGVGLGELRRHHLDEQTPGTGFYNGEYFFYFCKLFLNSLLLLNLLKDKLFPNPSFYFNHFQRIIIRENETNIKRFTTWTNIIKILLYIIIILLYYNIIILYFNNIRYYYIINKYY